MYKIIKLDVNQDERGQLVAIESSQNIPFDIKRVFYIFDVKQNTKRAQHANIKTQQVILCLNGSCEMFMDDGKGQKVSMKLSQKNEAVYVEPKVWLEMSEFSKNCLVIVISDTYHDKNDKINDYQEFLRQCK